MSQRNFKIPCSSLFCVIIINRIVKIRGCNFNSDFARLFKFVPHLTKWAFVFIVRLCCWLTVCTFWDWMNKTMLNGKLLKIKLINFRYVLKYYLSNGNFEFRVLRSMAFLSAEFLWHSLYACLKLHLLKEVLPIWINSNQFKNSIPNEQKKSSLKMCFAIFEKGNKSYFSHPRFPPILPLCFVVAKSNC